MSWDGPWGWSWAGLWGGYEDGAPAPAGPSCIKTRRFKLLGYAISVAIAKGFRGKLMPATLVRVCSFGPVAGNLAGPSTTETHTFTAEGFLEEYSERISPEMIKAGARKVVLIAGSIKGEGYTWVVPESGDQVTIESVAYVIGRVDSDPAGATYTLHGRRA